jgi:hypothetical protein
MSPRKIEISPELIAEGRRLYERTQTPLQDIAATMGICRRTLENRIREWNWTRRRIASRPIELLHAVRGAAIATMTGDAPPSARNSSAPVSPERRAALAERIQNVAERELDAVERVLALMGPSDQAEAEQATRTLASISRILREVAALNQPTEVISPDETDDDALPLDMDAFRDELARKIQSFIDARQDGAPGIGDETLPGIDGGSA